VGDCTGVGERASVDRTRFFSIAGQMNLQQPALLAAEMMKLPSGGQVILAFDSDTAGDLFTAQVRQIYSDLGRTDISFVVDRPSSRESDWNDVLRKHAEGGFSPKP